MKKIDREITPIATALGKPRHPHRSEMTDVYHAERLMLAARRKAETVIDKARKEAEAIVKGPQEIFLLACEAMQETCDVGPGLSLDTNSCKWMTRQNPADNQSPFVVVDFSKESS